MLARGALAAVLGGNAALGLLAAALWGGGDFAGSIAVKRGGADVPGALRVVVIGHAVSLAVVACVAWSLHLPLPPLSSLLWGVLGGTISGVSLVAFYMALASGHMGSAAAVSGLLCALVPAVVSAFTEGSPGLKRLAGFLLAGAAIWFIASADSGAETSPSQRAMLLSILGGLGFGFYFAALKVAGTAGVLWSMAAARVGSLSIAAILLGAVFLRGTSTSAQTQRERWSSPLSLAWILGGAALDSGGNLSFIAATRAGRLDVAAVLASIYPAGTILLASLVLKEKTSRRQKLGMLVALCAVVLITL